MVPAEVAGRSANLSEGTADMNADGKSDSFVLPTTQANKVGLVNRIGGRVDAQEVAQVGDIARFRTLRTS